MHLTRREAGIRLVALMSATALGPRLSAGTFGTSTGTPADFTAGQTALFDEIADTIIPPAAAPGTKSGRAWANAIT